MEPTVEPSYLHRRFAIPLGDAPARFYRPDPTCESSESLFESIAGYLIVFACIAAAFGFAHSSWWFLGTTTIVPGVILMRLTDRFLSRERLARAQKRRSAELEQPSA